MRPGYPILLLITQVVLSGCRAVPASRMVDGGVLTPLGLPPHEHLCAAPMACGAMPDGSPQEVALRTILSGPVQALVAAGDSAALRDTTMCGHVGSVSPVQHGAHIAAACRAVAAALAQADRAALAQRLDALRRLINERRRFLAAHPYDGALGKTWCRRCAALHGSRVLFALCQVMLRLSQVEERWISPCGAPAPAPAAGAAP